jgi:AAA15 family ATPase/GTPase
MNSNFIEHISISNFKSIRSLELSDFKRINLFIGRPNVGKSNIIEALSLFTIPYLRENTSKKLNNLIRLEHEAELFYNGNILVKTEILTNIGNCKMNYHPKEGLIIQVDLTNISYTFNVDSKFVVKGGRKSEHFDPPIKRYEYKSEVFYKKDHAKYLIPPFGHNLLSVIEQYEVLREEVRSLFMEYALDIAFDKASQTIKIIQNKDKDNIFLIPYNSIADTLQRVIFYKAAIVSNNNSVLLFEEPEAHSFPPYMTHFTQEIIHKEDNQFFIATHSPFILNDLLENARPELAVFIVEYKNMCTSVKKLSEKELHDIYQNGVDLFTNSESYT